MSRILDWLPLGMRQWWQNRRRWRWFRGDYRDWAEARQHATDGDGAASLNRVYAAARDVRSGRAAWDRDGVSFVQPEVHAPLLLALKRAQRENQPGFTLVDFGGGLGCTYWQHRRVLAPSVHAWRIVERAELVAAGRREFAVPPLEFHQTLDSALAVGPAQALLLSSVLAYLEDPVELLRDVASREFDDIIVDRTPVIAGQRDRVVVQHTPPQLGGGTHPCRLFVRSTLLAPLAATYELVAEWPVEFDRVDPEVAFVGFHFRRRSVMREDVQ